MTVIDEYLEKLEPLQIKQLKRIREIAKQVIPDAQEVICYGMPTLQYNGKSFLGFNAYRNHIGIYPYGGEEIEVFKDKLNSYELSKVAIRVPYYTSIPENLLTEIIRHRINRISVKNETL